MSFILFGLTLNRTLDRTLNLTLNLKYPLVIPRSLPKTFTKTFPLTLVWSNATVLAARALFYPLLPYCTQGKFRHWTRHSRNVVYHQIGKSVKERILFWFRSTKFGISHKSPISCSKNISTRLPKSNWKSAVIPKIASPTNKSKPTWTIF